MSAHSCQIPRPGVGIAAIEEAVGAPVGVDGAPDVLDRAPELLGARGDLAGVGDQAVRITAVDAIESLDGVQICSSFRSAAWVRPLPTEKSCGC